MKFDAIYSRQSIDKKDSVSIEAQIDMCKSYLTKDEYELYTDKGWSGKNTDRPKMNQLISDVKNDKISTIIVYRLDRISRNIVDFGNLLSLFNEHNVEFVSSSENFDTSSPMGRAMVYIVMVFAQLERETIAKRIGDNYKFRCATGKYFMGGGVPFGYKSEKIIIDGKKASAITPNENAPILQDIFSRFSNGESIGSIVKDLNRNDIKTVNNKLWSATAIKRILQNITPCVADEKICEYLSAYGYNITNSIDEFDEEHGMCIFMKQKPNHVDADISEQIVSVGIHKPLITSDEYIKSQLLLDRNKENTSIKSSKNTFLAGMIKCKECNHSFGVKTVPKKNKKYLYYLCRSRLSKGVCDNTLYIAADKLEKDIIKASIEYLENYNINSVTVKENRDTLNHSDEINILESQIKNLIDNIGKGTNFIDDLLTSKITELQSRILELRKNQQKDIHNTVNINIADQIKLKLINFDQYSIDEKTENIKKLIKYITIDKDGFTDIKFLI
jgi:DNA invertase Pin-like site-specific DNA recombinase